MKRTTVTLPDEIAVVLEREARRRGTSVSEVTRQALMAYLGLPSAEPRRLPFVALGHSGHRHTARDAEEILAEEWGRAGDR
ncbi:MAG: CopG family transcriptional regulator [Chloroflexi bacterium]|nr:CopG family transcriptional regulator [Chloroflexota bacterium]